MNIKSPMTLIGAKWTPASYGCAAVLLVMLLALLPAQLKAQTTGSLSGIVTDNSGGVVPGAKVVATNSATGDKVNTVSGGEGTFTFPTLSPGTYTISVTATGFQTLQQQGLVVTAGARLSIPPLALPVGTVSQTITVQSNVQSLQTDNGQLGSVLSTQDLGKLALVSQNSLELLKVLPGVILMPPGTGNGTNYDFLNVGAEGSPIGFGVASYGAPPEGGVANLLDGVNVNDPGCNCWSIATVFPEMVSEISFQTSNFSADVAHGPVVISTISKSGTSSYHGEAYYFARNDVLNANDWLDNHDAVPRGHASYNYPGGSVGGPIPFTHKKVLFWFGYERILQNLGNAASVISHIPTADMMAGNFTATSDNLVLCPNGISAANNGSYCNNLQGTYLPDGTQIGVTPGVPAGQIPAQFLTTRAALNAQALAKVWPKANITPSAGNGYADYSKVIPAIHDGYVWRGRVDYNYSDNTKVYVAYQYGTDNQPSGPAGTEMYTEATNAIPYPGGTITEPNYSKTLSAHLIHSFTPTLTNEFVAAIGYANNPQVIPNPSAVFRTTVGFVGGTIFNNGDLFMPSYLTGTASTQTYPDLGQPDWIGDYAAAGDRDNYTLIKETPTIADNLVKVWGAHTIKVGEFYEMVDNDQSNNGLYANGTLRFDGPPALNAVSNVEVGSPNNPLANFVLGNATSYHENSADPVGDLAYKTFAPYVDDSWRVNKKLNIDVGFRFDQVGRWYDRGVNGIPVFDAAKVATDFQGGNATAPGVSWYGINSGVPKTGMPTPFVEVAPRFGISYDVFGNGNSLVRGGWGRYHWGDDWDDMSGALAVAQGVQSFNLPNNIDVLLDQIGSGEPNEVTGAHDISPSTLGTTCCAGSVTAADPNDRKVPETDSYNFTIDQQLPWSTHLELSYIGNQTHNALIGGDSDVTLGGGNDYINVNKMPLGALFNPDPVTGVKSPNPENIGGPGSPNNKAADYQPYGYAYGSNPIYVLNHAGYGNYNGFSVILERQARNLAFNASYTHGKALGTNLYENAYSLRGNYGVSNFDRPNALTMTYSYDVLNAYRGSNKLLSGAIDNWMISGTTLWAGGGNLQALSSPNFGMNLQYTSSAPLPAGVTPSYGAATYYGTTAHMLVTPLASCNPGSGLAENQHVRVSCFAPPAIGSYGPRNYPYLSGPSYTDADLAINKVFHITESNTIMFRASAFDWINHPLAAFSGAQQLTLYYNTDYTSKMSTLSSSTSPTFGFTDTKAGGDTRRVVELEVKYSF